MKAIQNIIRTYPIFKVNINANDYFVGINNPSGKPNYKHVNLARIVFHSLLKRMNIISGKELKHTISISNNNNRLYTFCDVTPKLDSGVLKKQLYPVNFNHMDYERACLNLNSLKDSLKDNQLYSYDQFNTDYGLRVQKANNLQMNDFLKRFTFDKWYLKYQEMIRSNQSDKKISDFKIDCKNKNITLNDYWTFNLLRYNILTDYSSTSITANELFHIIKQNLLSGVPHSDKKELVRLLETLRSLQRQAYFDHNLYSNITSGSSTFKDYFEETKIRIRETMIADIDNEIFLLATNTITNYIKKNNKELSKDYKQYFTKILFFVEKIVQDDIEHCY